MDFWSRIYQLGKVCIACGSLFPNDSYFCEPCYLKINDHRCRKLESIQGIRFPTFSLYNWIQDRSRPVSLLVEHQKGQMDLASANFYAKELVVERRLVKEFCFDMIVPAPTFRPRQQNHALWLAKAIGRELGVPVLDCLQKATTETQKTKKKLERKSISIRCTENISSSTKVLLIDDIITTGSTAKACYLAMNKPQIFELWTLAHRRQLATELKQ